MIQSEGSSTTVHSTPRVAFMACCGGLFARLSLASRSSPTFHVGSEEPTSTAANANDLPLEIKCDICHSLNHLPSLLNLAQASSAFVEPASSHVRTLQALDDLPGRAWDRFTCADGLKLLLNLSQQQQVSQLWQQTAERMPARVRRCVVESQQAAEQQQASDDIVSVGSIMAAGLAASVCASHLQQLTIDAPVSTVEASQLMALLAALQRLELNQLRSTAIGQQGPGQQGQLHMPWRPAHVPQGLLHLQLQGSPGQEVQLDARPFAAAKGLCSLQLLEHISVHTLMAFTQLSQLSCLTIASEPGDQVLEQICAPSTPLQALRHASLLWQGWWRPQDLPQVERLQLHGFTLAAWPGVRVHSVKHLTLANVHLLPPGDGFLTQALPALEVLEVITGIVLCRQGLNVLCRGLSCHTALHSLLLQCRQWRRAYGVAQPWPQQGLASISSLTQLQVLNLLAADVPGLLLDIASCTALRELHLGLGEGQWSWLDGACRQQLRALQASSSSVRRCTIEGLLDDE
jgi:hypothetical protein